LGNEVKPDYQCFCFQLALLTSGCPQQERLDGNTATPSDKTTTGNNQWQIGVIQQTLKEIPNDLKLLNKYKDIHAQLVSKLKAIFDNENILITQASIDEISAQILLQIEPDLTAKTKKSKRTRESKQHASRKRKMKKYKYSRTQELFRKNPKLLGRYIREGIQWLEDTTSELLNPNDIKSFFTQLWSTSLTIDIPFNVS
jgi:hypothetical protein